MYRLLAKIGIIALAMSCVVMPPRVSIAQPGRSGYWLTEVGIRRQFARPGSFSWSGTSLREAIEGVSRSTHIAVLIDRRVDPGQRLNLSFSGISLHEALHRLSLDRGLAFAGAGPLLYFGPPEVVGTLRTLLALRRRDVTQLSHERIRRHFQRARRFVWDDLATPQELMTRLAREADIVIDNLDVIPHDLWAAADLPEIPLCDRLTLIAVQFDLTYSLNDVGHIKLVPLPGHIYLDRRYPGRPSAQATASRFRKALPEECKVWVEGNEVVVRGLLEHHERLAVRRPSRIAVAPSTARSGEEAMQDIEAVRISRFHVADVPAKQLLEEIGRRLGLEIKIDNKAIAAAGVSLDERLSVNVEAVTVDELLSRIVSKLGLVHTRDGRSVKITLP